MVLPFLLMVLSGLGIPGTGTPQGASYLEEIQRERAERERIFRDPLRSPLATVGIFLVDGSPRWFGSGDGDDFRWPGEGIQARHLRIDSDSGKLWLEAGGGAVYDPSGSPVRGRRLWEPETEYRVGSLFLLHQIHPVGPVIRVVDPTAEALVLFRGLHYFPPDPAYRVQARIRPQPLQGVTVFDTQGWKRSAFVYGKLEFHLQGIPQELDLLLFDPDPGPESRFMLIFQDGTSGTETYPACRYLYLPFQSEGTLWVDFNQATNPSCAYGDGFACPLPLPGNRLAVPVRAGEKTYKGARKPPLALDLFQLDSTRMRSILREMSARRSRFPPGTSAAAQPRKPISARAFITAGQSQSPSPSGTSKPA